ncbi:hypothetical protein D9Q98_002020 [Chlorella vulgaris]|uniref:PH domain-containing protein n=1 Tax=Chlorella vulgaris TaxID=3077 RepID=A0A9D4Z0U6_CHLVU|nr:hypothetical protein D9Q98_002020 [Chlorella vulgaris]
MEPSQLFNKVLGRNSETGGVEFWRQPERAGWLMKQGEFMKTWRRRWFILKDGKIFWFKSDLVGPSTQPRGIIEVNKCLSIKGAEDAINKPHAFEISTTDQNMYFIADSDKEKEDWINAVGRAIVRHSKSMMDRDQVDYNTGY